MYRQMHTSKGGVNMKTWKKICVGSAIGITIGGSIYCGNKLMSDKPVEASTIIETATDAVAATVEDVVVAAETTEEPEPEIAEDDKKDNSKVDNKKDDSKSDDKKDDSKVDDKKGVGSDSGTENVVSKKEPAANVESTKPATKEEPKPAPEAPKPEKPAPEAPKPTKPATTEAPKPEKPATTEAPKPAKPTTPEAPKHQHDYSVWVVDVPASTKTVVDKEAWTETVEHEAETHKVMGVACHYCGQWFDTSTECKAHLSTFDTTDLHHAVAGYGTKAKTIVDKEAWTETINHPAETHEETVPEQGHWECSCGAKK